MTLFHLKTSNNTRYYEALIFINLRFPKSMYFSKHLQGSWSKFEEIFAEFWYFEILPPKLIFTEIHWNSLKCSFCTIYTYILLCFDFGNKISFIQNSTNTCSNIDHDHSKCLETIDLFIIQHFEIILNKYYLRFWGAMI